MDRPMTSTTEARGLRYQVHTFGCKVNTYDSGLIQKNLTRSGYELALSDPETRVHVLNTCAVTAEATKEAVRYIRRLKVKDPFCTVVVTGCAAQVDTGAFSELPGADLVVANSHKGQLPEILEKYFKGGITDKVFKSNIFRKEDLEAGGGVEKFHTRAFLKIQDGCNSFCTYCIIPYARGKSRSIPIADLVQRVNDLYLQGVREVVLTGVHIGDYEDSAQNKTLEDLIETLLHKTFIPRFRLSSLEPVEVSARLLDLYENNPRLCPHFHMSIQSAQTEVLAHMKRKYTQGDVQQSLRRINERLPQAFIGMDVIVGFPTETHEQFEETFLTLAELPWTKLHVFPYSERPGTRAAALTESVRWEERLRRASRLRELSLHRFETRAREQIGQTKRALILKSQNQQTRGLSQDYWSLQIEGLVPAEKIGHEIHVLITGYENKNKNQMEGHLTAQILQAGTAR